MLLIQSSRSMIATIVIALLQDERAFGNICAAGRIQFTVPFFPWLLEVRFSLLRLGRHVEILRHYKVLSLLLNFQINRLRRKIPQPKSSPARKWHELL
ncbi:hypothetical protein BJ166DRAFT_517743 [Pestalotiopsis sp. NC0098]|nr:hypothetical protein BJ166DRAFT_517743 [Pestalotiopsis sp. NC0098]